MVVQGNYESLLKENNRYEPSLVSTPQELNNKHIQTISPIDVLKSVLLNINDSQKGRMIPSRYWNHEMI